LYFCFRNSEASGWKSNFFSKYAVRVRVPSCLRCERQGEVEGERKGEEEGEGEEAENEEGEDEDGQEICNDEAESAGIEGR
jgi:hypothetical protein